MPRARPLGQVGYRGGMDRSRSLRRCGAPAWVRSPTSRVAHRCGRSRAMNEATLCPTLLPEDFSTFGGQSFMRMEGAYALDLGRLVAGARYSFGSPRPQYGF